MSGKGKNDQFIHFMLFLQFLPKSGVSGIPSFLLLDFHRKALKQTSLRAKLDQASGKRQQSLQKGKGLIWVDLAVVGWIWFPLTGPVRAYIDTL